MSEEESLIIHEEEVVADLETLHNHEGLDNSNSATVGIIGCAAMPPFC